MVQFIYALGDNVQFIYALLSIIVIVLVIVFGAAWGSNYMPPRQKRKARTKAGRGGESDASTD
jgi:hypothetical protein